ncbi:MAG: RidA family protein [Candidatus Flexifilum sp.]|jgi:enamine deaminase RidA (YjgF/YER057c/UK114 family)
MTARQCISSGTPWEQIAGYSRAVRIGDHVFVSGTTASDETGAVQAPGDAYGQTIYILRKIERALEQAGASLRDVVRTRIFVTDMARWEEVARAHGEIFGAIRPANSLIGVSALVSPAHLVEIEVDALIGAGS